MYELEDGPDLGAQPADLRRPASARASPARRCLPTRRRPSAPAASSRSCGRCRGSCRRRATTSRTARHLRQDRPRDLARRPASSSRPICRARSRRSTTCTSSATSPTRPPKRPHAIEGYIDYLETDLAPRAKASFRLGTREVRAEAEARRGHHASAPSGCWRSRCASSTRCRRNSAASPAGCNGGDSMAGVARGQGAASRAGEAGQAAQEQVKELEEFLRRQAIVSCPTASRSSWRRRRSSTAGRLPACGRRGRSRQAEPRVLLPDRRRSQLAAGAAEGAPARLQLADALEHLDPRGVSRATSCTSSTCGRSSRRSASRSSSLRPRSSRGGRTTASR